jgi:hypothetical protein
MENFLSSGKFLINLHRLPGVDFYCQSISTPDVSINSNGVKYIAGQTFETDTQISYGNLTINFIVDENLNNYNQVLNWMKGISPDFSLDESKDLLDETKQNGAGFDYTDIELIFPKSKKSYIYKNCVPQSLSGLEFNVSEDLFITASITFNVPQIEITSSN